MVSALRDYAYNEEENDPEELRAVYDNILYARCVYERYLHTWIAEAKEKFKERISVPALPRVKKFFLEHDSATILDKANRYFRKAELTPEERSEPLEIVSNSSGSSAAFLEVISTLMDDHSQEMSQISDRMIDAEVAAEQSRKKADREGQKAEEECQRAEEERQRAE